METPEAKVFATKRYRELGAEFPQFTPEYRVNLIIKELRQKHNFATMCFSSQHRGWAPIKTVKFATDADPIVTFNV
jgi:hypothetical protein